MATTKRTSTGPVVRRSASTGRFVTKSDSSTIVRREKALDRMIDGVVKRYDKALRKLDNR